jgi:hypothetical protein
MAFNVSNLSDYTLAAKELLRSVALYSESFGRFDYMTGISHKQYLNYISSNPSIQAGTCGLDASGTTLFTEKEIQVFPIAFREKYCIDDLNKKDLAFGGGKGTLNGVMIPDLHTSLLVENSNSIKKQLEKLVFAGNTASGDLFDGFITQFTADADVIDIPSVAVDVNNIDNILQDIALAVTETMWARNEMIYIHLPLAYYNLYRVNRTNNNLFHDDPKNKGLMSMDMFGWEGMITIVAEPSLAGTKTIFATWDNNLVVGSDEITEISSAKMYYDENTDYVKYKASLKLGVAYKFGEEVIMFVGA